MPSLYCLLISPRVLEQTLEGIDQLDRRGSREQALALIIHRREVVVQRLATVKNGVPRKGGGVLIDKVVNILVHIQGVGFDVRGENRHGRVKDALAEVIQRHGEVGTGEVQINALLRRNLQGRAGFGRVLRRQVAPVRTVYSFGRRILSESPIFAPSLAKDESYSRVMLPTKLSFGAERGGIRALLRWGVRRVLGI